MRPPRLAGGVWRLATDWADYAAHVDEVLAGEPRLSGGRTERWAERPVTKFERKGLRAGREITDLEYRRVAAAFEPADGPDLAPRGGL